MWYFVLEKPYKICSIKEKAFTKSIKKQISLSFLTNVFVTFPFNPFNVFLIILILLYGESASDTNWFIHSSTRTGLTWQSEKYWETKPENIEAKHSLYGAISFLPILAGSSLDLFEIPLWPIYPWIQNLTCNLTTKKNNTSGIISRLHFFENCPLYYLRHLKQVPNKNYTQFIT